MRVSIAACLVAVALAGCSDGERPSEPSAEPGVEGCAEAERGGVVLWTGNYASSAAQPFTLSVDVPECARDARFELSTLLVGSPNAATVSLEGCGSVDLFGPSNVNVAVPMTNGHGVLCDAPASGAQPFTVSATGPMTGTVTLRADLPVD